MNKFIFLIMALLLHGCASILSNSAYPVLIESNPAGAGFVIKNRNGIEVAHGQTPATITLESGAGYFKKADYTVQVFKPGFQSQTYRLNSYINDWYWGNVLNPIGMLLVDPATGAMWSLPLRLTALLPKETAIIRPY
ncbi:MAG: hypothetical protein WC685_03095 [Methylobacter sp.]|jgi:hypothetical protein